MSQFVSERLAVLYKKIHPDISMTNSEVSVKIRQRFVNWNRPSGKLTKLSKIQASRSSRLKAVCDFLDAPFIVHSDTPTPRGTPITPGETSTPEENFTATPENLSRKRHLASATPASTVSPKRVKRKRSMNEPDSASSISDTLAQESNSSNSSLEPDSASSISNTVAQESNSSNSSLKHEASGPRLGWLCPLCTGPNGSFAEKCSWCNVGTKAASNCSIQGKKTSSSAKPRNLTDWSLQVDSPINPKTNAPSQNLEIEHQ
eukprot:580673_1